MSKIKIPASQTEGAIFKMNTARTIFCLLLAGCVLAAFSSNAEVYRWVDKDGKVQYSDKPPPEEAAKAGVKTVDTKPPATTGAKPPAAVKESWQEKELEFKKRRLAAEQKQAQEAEKAQANEQAAEEKKARCTKAKWRLKDLQDPSPVFSRDEKGERVYLQDKDREAEIARTKEDIAKLCE